MVLNVPRLDAKSPTTQWDPPDTLPVRTTDPTPRCVYVIFAM